MIQIIKIVNNYLVGTNDVLSFRNKKSMIQLLNEELYKLYDEAGNKIEHQENTVKINYAYHLTYEDDYITDTMGRTRNYKKYFVEVPFVVLKSYNEAINYLEGLIQDIISSLTEEPDEFELSDDILDILKEE